MVSTVIDPAGLAVPAEQYLAVTSVGIVNVNLPAGVALEVRDELVHGDFIADVPTLLDAVLKGALS